MLYWSNNLRCIVVKVDVTLMHHDVRHILPRKITLRWIFCVKLTRLQLIRTQETFRALSQSQVGIH